MNPTPLHIVYIGPFRFPAGDAAAARVLANARCLREAGHQVRFISYGGSYRASDKTDNGYSYDDFPYTISNDIDRPALSVFKRLSGFLKMGANAWNMLRSGEAPDVVIAYNPNLYLSMRLLHLARKTSIRIVADISECYHPSEFPGGRWLPFAWINELQIRIVQKWLPNKILISSFLNAMYPNSHNLVLPPLVDMQERKWIAETGDDFKGLTCIYAGTPSRKDQMLFVLDAIRLSVAMGADIRLVLLGDEQEELKAYMQRDEMNACRERVIFLGVVPQEQVPAYYGSAHFSLLFRKQNRKNNAGFPTKFVESLASGTPVIGNLTSDIGKYLNEGENGFVLEEATDESLAVLLHTVSRLSTEQLELMKDNARRSAGQFFDYRKYSVQMKQFIENLK